MDCALYLGWSGDRQWFRALVTPAEGFDRRREFAADLRAHPLRHRIAKAPPEYRARSLPQRRRQEQVETLADLGNPGAVSQCLVPSSREDRAAPECLPPPCDRCRPGARPRVPPIDAVPARQDAAPRESLPPQSPPKRVLG